MDSAQLDALLRLAEKPDCNMDELITLADAVKPLIERVRELERQMDTLAGFAAMSEVCVLDKCAECEHRNGNVCELDFFDRKDCYQEAAKEVRE